MFRLLLPLLFLLPVSLAAQDMSNVRLDSIFHAVLDSVSGDLGRWELTFGEVKMLCLTDENNDRMRLITPVQDVKEATPAEIFACMEANFHSALDVKYALSDDFIWVAYIHPLSPLRDDQLLDAISQVRNAALTYGTIYTSTNLTFPGSKAEEKREEVKKKKKKGNKS
ncbi:MAG: hypothetical protein ACJAZ9_000038 [Neolewinella sp.]|jgi:hypothetical protein